MAASTLVGLLLDAWDDADRAFAGLTEVEALARPEGGSAFAWTRAHLTGQMDYILNVLIRGGALHPAVQEQNERHGYSGDASDWEGIERATRDVRAAVRAYLEPLSDADLERIQSPPTQYWPAASLRYILYRIITHHDYHIGEVAALRNRAGQPTGDYPGRLERAV